MILNHLSLQLLIWYSLKHHHWLLASHVPSNFKLKQSLPFLQASPWTSPDGLATLTRPAGSVNALHVSVSALLEMDITSASETEIIVDPSVQFLNLDITKITTSHSVHGVSAV